MKHNQTSHVDRLTHFIYIILPFLILIPRTNVPPPPTMPLHLPSQEFIHSLAAAILALLGLIRFWQKQDLPQRTRLQNLSFLFFSLFVSYQFITLFWTPDFAEGFRVASLWVCFGIYLFFGLPLITNKLRDQIYLSFSVALTLLSLYQIALFLQYGADFVGILYSFYLKAELLTLFIPLQILVFLTTKNKGRAYFALFGFCVAWLAEMQLFKRGPLLGIFLSLLCLSLALYVFRKTFPLSLQKIAVVAGCFIFIAGSQIVLQRSFFKERLNDATNLNAPGQVSEAYNRFYYAAVAWEMFKDKPAFGDGVGAYNADFAQYRKAYVNNPAYEKIRSVSNSKTDATEFHARSTNAHNEFLQILGETGLIGFLIFALFWIFIGALLWHKRSALPLFVLATFCGFIAYIVSSAITSFSFRASPGIVAISCLLLLSLGGATEKLSDKAEPTYIRGQLFFSAVASLLLLLSSIFCIRAFCVMRSYQIEAPLDFNFDPNNPDKNLRLLTDYQEVFALDPLNAGAHLSAGILSYQLKRPQEAVKHLEFAVNHGFNRPWAVSILAFAYEQTNQKQKAVPLLQGCLQAFPSSVYGRVIYAEFLRQVGNLAEYRQQLDVLKQNSDIENEARTWFIALQMKPDEANIEIKRLNLPTLESLNPIASTKLQQIMIQIRSFHYL